MRSEARARLTHLLADGAIICPPTTPFPAPAKGQAISALDIVRDRITCLTAHGGLTGVPQVSIPGTTVNGLPVGLSIIGAHGQDAMLVAVSKAVEEMA
jgi:amidase